MRTSVAVYLGIIYSYLPFMVLPLFATPEAFDRTLLGAAADLGSPPWRTFIDITLPLSLPGVIAGSMLVFIPAVGEFVIPSLLGGPDTLMIGRVLWDEFFWLLTDRPVTAARSRSPSWFCSRVQSRSTSTTTSSRRETLKAHRSNALLTAVADDAPVSSASQSSTSRS